MLLVLRNRRKHDPLVEIMKLTKFDLDGASKSEAPNQRLIHFIRGCDALGCRGRSA